MIALPVELAAELALYQRALARAPLAGATRAKYVARVRGFLVWLATTDLSAYGSAADQAGEPLTDPAARDGAVRDWRVWAKTVGRQARSGLGAATARREALPRRAPKALSAREVVRYLRAVEHCGCARDTVVALLPFYAGLRIGEVVGLDLAAPTADAAEFALEELEEKCRNTVRATGPIHAVG
jgi:integrase